MIDSVCVCVCGGGGGGANVHLYMELAISIPMHMIFRKAYRCPILLLLSPLLKMFRQEQEKESYKGDKW